MSRLAAFVMALLIVIAGTLSAPAASADSSAGVELTDTLNFDGSGHGTSQGSFITSARGFAVADDSPHDGVVSSGDTAQYTMAAKFLPGAARTVTIELVEPAYLHVLSDTTYTRTLVKGETRTLTMQVDVEAKDSGATAKTGQRIRANIYVDGVLSDHVDFTPLTVVSAPFADLKLIGGGTTATGSSQIEIRPVALRPNGFPNTHGASAGGAWTAKLDVSDAPAGSSWWAATYRATSSWIVGNQLEPDDDGLIAVSGQPGQSMYVVWQGPADGSQFDVHLVVDPTSFTVDPGNPNNGDSTQPGDGLSRDTSTANAATGATAGTYAANNDWTYIRSLLATYTGAPPFTAGFEAPYDNTKSMFNDRNLNGAEGVVWQYRPTVAPSTLGVETGSVRNDLSAYGYARDTYDLVYGVTLTDEQVERFNNHYKVGDLVTVGGTAVPVSELVIQWSATARSDTDIANLADTSGWVTGMPGDDAVSMRVVVPRAVLNQFATSSTVTWRVGVSIRTASELDSAGVTSSAASRYRSTFGIFVAAANAYTVSQTHNVVVYRNVDKTQSLEVTPTSYYTGRIVDAGTQLGQRLFPAGYVNLGGVDESEVLRPTITWNLDPCIATVQIPTNKAITSAYLWNFTITPPTAGTDGLICGSANSTGMTVTATLKTGVWAPDIATDLSANLTLPNLDGLVHPNASSGTLLSTVTVSWGADSDRDPVTSTTAPVTVRAKTDNSAATTTSAYVDRGFNPTWRFDLAAIASGGVSFGTDTVLILPFAGDDTLTSGVANMDVYDGPTASAFTTRPQLADANLIGEVTSTGAVLYFTTNPAPTFTASDSTWYPVADAGSTAPDLSGATALRIVVPSTPGRNTTGSLELTLAQPGDAVTGDDYVVWTGPTLLNGGPSAIARPWPSAVTVSESYLDGYVTWDTNASGDYDSDDQPIADMPVDVYEGLFTGGVIPTDATPLMSTTTNAFGYFQAVVPAGVYTVKIGRNSATAATVDRWGNTTGVGIAYSSQQRYADPNIGPFGDTVWSDSEDMLVDHFERDTIYLGFDKPDTDLTFDVTPIASDCEAAAASDVCDASWNVNITNTGNQDLTGSVTMNVNSPDVQVGDDSDVTIPAVGSWKAIAGDSYRLYAIDANNDVWAWGSSYVDGNYTWTGTPTRYAPLTGMKVASLYEPSQHSDMMFVFTTAGQVYRLDSYSGTLTPFTGPDNTPVDLTRGLWNTYNTLFALDRDGALWSAPISGYASESELGRPTQAAGTDEFAPVLDNDGAAIHATAMTGANYGQVVFAADANDGIWSWGYPYSGIARDVVSYPYDDAYEPRKVKNSDGARFTSLAGAGSQNAIAVDSRGNVWRIPLSNTSTWDDATSTSWVNYDGITPWATSDGGQVRASAVDNTSASSTDTAYMLQSGGAFTVTTDYSTGGLTVTPADNSAAYAGATRIAHSGYSLYAVSPTGVWAVLYSGSWVSGYITTFGGYGTTTDNPVLRDTTTNTAVQAEAFSNGSGPTAAGWIDRNGVLHYWGMSSYARDVYFDDYDGVFRKDTAALLNFSTPRTMLSYSDEHQSTTVTPTITRSTTHTFITLDLPGAIKPGETLSIPVVTKVATPDVTPPSTSQHNLLVQAWWTGASTPIAALLTAGKTTPDLPVDPGASLRSSGILGNATCSADVDTTPEDQCDQVATAFATYDASIDDPQDPEDPQTPAVTPDPVVTPTTGTDPAAPSTPGTLSHTGADAAKFAAIALALLIFGGVAVVASRRRVGEYELGD